MMDIGYWFFPLYNVFSFLEVFAIFAWSPWMPPVLLTKWAIMPSTPMLGVDIVGSTRRGCGVDARMCWVPWNDTSCRVKLWLRLRYFVLVMDVIHISWKYHHFMEISTFCGYSPHFVDVSVFCGYSPFFVKISMFCGYYPQVVEISTFRRYYPHCPQ